jgi:hypothetical protein
LTVRFFDPRRLCFGTSGISAARCDAYERYKKATLAKAPPQVRKLAALYLHDAKLVAAVVDRERGCIQIRYRCCGWDEQMRTSTIEYLDARMSHQAKRALDHALRTGEDALVSEVVKTSEGYLHRVAFWQERGKPALQMAVAFSRARVKTVATRAGPA